MGFLGWYVVFYVLKRLFWVDCRVRRTKGGDFLEAVLVMEVRDDEGLDKEGSKKWLGFGYSFKIDRFYKWIVCRVGEKLRV